MRSSLNHFHSVIDLRATNKTAKTNILRPKSANFGAMVDANIKANAHTGTLETEGGRLGTGTCLGPTYMPAKATQQLTPEAISIQMLQQPPVRRGFDHGARY
jgi:hypothetical protein